MKGKCAKCGTFRKWLHKHHRKPRCKGGTDADGVEYICANCHEDEHGGPCGGVMRGRLAHSKRAQKKRAATMKKLWADPKYRSKQSRSRKKAWKSRDREAQAKVMANIWTPEKRRRHSIVLKKLRREFKGPTVTSTSKKAASKRLTELWADTRR